MGIELAGKIIAVTGASGTLGQALLRELLKQKAQPIALTTSPKGTLAVDVPVVQWIPGAETELRDRLQQVDILIINHGLNVYGARTVSAIDQSLQANALSGWRLMEVFLSILDADQEPRSREIWVNTSEAEVSPAFSPLYEVSKRLMGDLVTLRRLDSPCVIRKMILGPFKSKLNPVGVMSPDWVAWAVVTLAKRNFQDIIVTINPLTYLAFPVKEGGRSLYFRLFTRRQRSLNESY